MGIFLNLKNWNIFGISQVGKLTNFPNFLNVKNQNFDPKIGNFLNCSFIRFFARFLFPVLVTLVNSTVLHLSVLRFLNSKRQPFLLFEFLTLISSGKLGNIILNFFRKKYVKLVMFLKCKKQLKKFKRF